MYDINVDVCSIEDLISQIDYCEPLTEHFRRLAIDVRDDGQAQIDDGCVGLTRIERQRLKSTVAVIDDEGEGWDQWLSLAGKKALPRFIALVKDWLEDDIDWNEQDHFACNWSGQASAKAYFEDFDVDTLTALGVEIIEGDHPDSTYYAAELRKEVADANREALIRGLTCRFREGEGA